MGTLFRYLIISGIVLGLAVSAFVVRIDGRTPYGHLRQLGQGRFDNVLAEIQAGLDERLEQFREIVEKPGSKKAPKRSSSKKPSPPKAKPIPAERRREAGVERLREASTTISAKPSTLSKKKATRVDDKVSPEQERALERLLTSRTNP